MDDMIREIGLSQRTLFLVRTPLEAEGRSCGAVQTAGPADQLGGSEFGADGAVWREWGDSKSRDKLPARPGATVLKLRVDV